MDNSGKGESEQGGQFVTALALLGNFVRFRHLPPGSGHRCIGASSSGMIELEGIPGHFAAHLFVIDEDIEAVAGKAI